MYIKLNYFYFSAFDLKLKVTEILKYILLFSKKKLSFRKIFVIKIILLYSTKK